jgi:hypothetical protein
MSWRRWRLQPIRLAPVAGSAAITRAGMSSRLHRLAGVVVGTLAGSRVARAQQLLRPRAPALLVLAYAALVPVVLLGNAHLRPHSLGGLYEKLFLAIELAWLFVVSWSIAIPPAPERVPAAATR